MTARNPMRFQGIKKRLSEHYQPVAPLVEKVTGMKALTKRYLELESPESHFDFLVQAMEKLDLSYNLKGDLEASLPKKGAAIVVANHPFGGVETLLMAHMLFQHRKDIKIIANEIFTRIPEMADSVIGITPHHKKVDPLQFYSSAKQALKWLKQGGVLVVFPAGDIARFRWLQRRIAEGVWFPSIASLARRYKAPVIPMHFSGRNSLLFHTLGLAHPSLRKLQLPREFMNKGKLPTTIHVGKTIPSSHYALFQQNVSLTNYFRLHCLMLDNPTKTAGNEAQSVIANQFEQDIVEAVDPVLMQAEIKQIKDQCLIDSEKAQVYFARSHQVPHCLNEIGRLREISFRAVGEGSGKSIDLDKYDSYYVHLFIWNPTTLEIVGAYRLGLSDEILAQYGKKGFYTNSLFKYSGKFIRDLGPSLEMGRSFIRQEYQRSFSSLLLLWKGIGHFVVRHPQYAQLFGPVSISNTYNPLSQQLLIEFLKANNYDWKLSKRVHPRNPWKPINKMRPKWQKTEIKNINSIEGISELVSVLEEDGKGMPVLLKQYLKLSGRLLGFNVDTDFNDCLDGLILVDLRTTDPKVLQKYLSKDGVKSFLDYHQVSF